MVVREFALFWEAGKCRFPYNPDRPYPIQDLIGRINQALKQENPENQLSPKFKYICGFPDRFTASDRAFLEENDFSFHDIENRNQTCTKVKEDGSICGAHIDTEGDLAAGRLIELMLTETRYPDFPRRVLLISGNSDLHMATRSLATDGFTVFLAKKPNSSGTVYSSRFQVSGARVTFNWEAMLCGGGRLYQVGPKEWKVQGVGEDVVPWVEEAEGEVK